MESKINRQLDVIEMEKRMEEARRKGQDYCVSVRRNCRRSAVIEKKSDGTTEVVVISED